MDRESYIAERRRRLAEAEELGRGNDIPALIGRLVARYYRWVLSHFNG